MDYNTGNAIGSADARDLYDNAANLDKAMNSSAATWTDRFGVSRPTFKGAESELNEKVAAAAASAEEAAATADSIDDRYLGSKASDPATDNDGNPLQIGAEYYNTTTGYKRTYGISGWYTPNVDGQALGQSGPGQGADMVGYGEGQAYADGTVGAALQERLPEIGTYALLRAYSGPVTAFFVRGRDNVFDGAFGQFRADSADTTSVDNDCTVLVDAINRRWKRVYIGKASPMWAGAVGDMVADDTLAIRKICAASKSVDFGNRKYKVNFSESSPFVSYAATDGIDLVGDGALIYDTRTYSTQSMTPVFQFDACTNICVSGINYQGMPISDKSNPTSGIGYAGASFVALKNGCKRVRVVGELKYLRYGVRAGSYTTPSEGYNDEIEVDLKTVECGYPIALYLSSGVKANLYSEGSHRSAYIAGVQGAEIFAQFKDQYIAPVQVIISDAKTGTGTSRGCKNIDVKAYDLGSTTFVANSYCVGISPSRVDPGTKFQNIKVDFYVKGTDTAASTLGGFFTASSANIIDPSYPYNWEPTITIDGLKISGVIDRSEQTVSEHGVGEIYINTRDIGAHFATVRGLDVDCVTYLPGSGTKPRGFYFIVPGLTGRARVSNSDFGTAMPLEWESNTSSLSVFSAVAARATNSNINDLSRIHLVGCDIYDASIQPLANVTTLNTLIGGAGAQVRRKITELTLTGASVTWAGALPNNAIILGVTGRITQDITGATGFQVGDGTTVGRFANTNSLTAGSTINLSNSSDTTPKNQVGIGNIVVTAKTANFTAGKIRLVVEYILFSPPSA